LYDDLKAIIMKIDNPANFVEFTKFIVRFGAEDDPEVFDLLAEGIGRALRKMTVEQILTILVNFAHSLNPNAHDLFVAANQEFG
jgi:hypothetical protein